MQVSLSIADNKLRENEVTLAIQEILERELELAQYKLNRYQNWCNNFEKKYRMVSTEFMDKFESGELSDDDDFFDWFAATKGVKNWERKYHLLSGVKIA